MWILLLCLPFPLRWTASCPKGSAGLLTLPFLASIVHSIHQLTTGSETQDLSPLQQTSYGPHIVPGIMPIMPICCLTLALRGRKYVATMPIACKQPWRNCVCTPFEHAALRILPKRKNAAGKTSLCLVCSLLIVGYRPRGPSHHEFESHYSCYPGLNIERTKT